MVTTKGRRARPVAALATLAGLALLVSACSTPGGSAASPATTSPASTAATAASPASSAGPASSPASPPASSPGAPATQGAASTFLAQSQDINGTAWYKPACDGYGCALSGDSTAFLYKMHWMAWSSDTAVGMGTDKIDACNPDCAAGEVYPVTALVTLSQPVKACLSSGPRWFFTSVSFVFPDGLPAALEGQNAPQNPWTFSSVVSAAQASCS